MSLRVTVLLAVAVLVIVAFAAVAGSTTRIATFDRVLVVQNGNAPPAIDVRHLPVRVRQPQFEQRFLGALAVIAAVTLLAALWLTNRLVLAPIASLTRAVRAMQSGSLAQRVNVDRNDEIGELARSFNALAERLERSEQRRRELIADIAHELRTPLTNIRGSIESLQDGVVNASPEELRALHGDAMLLQRLIGDLHELSAGDAGMLALRREPVDLAAELATAVRPAGPRVVLDVPPDLPAVFCDVARVRQVLGNVLANALRYAPVETPVVVRAQCHGDAVRVSVEDRGPGFPPDEAEAIFERFYRVDDSRSRETGGSGLGLAIAKQLVEAHGGNIGASINAYGGATVWFTLPLATTAIR